MARTALMVCTDIQVHRLFRTNSYSGSNYWVDVVFTANGGSDVTAPAVVSVSPVNNATGVSTSASVTAVFSESLSASSVTGSTVFLRAGGNHGSGIAKLYGGQYGYCTLTPSSALSASTVYTVTIKGRQRAVSWMYRAMRWRWIMYGVLRRLQTEGPVAL